MSDLPNLFNDYSHNQFVEQEESRSTGSKVLISVIVIGLVGAFGAIAYYGLGPTLIKPYSPPIASKAPDVAEVLGLSSGSNGSGINAITDNKTKQQLLQRLASQVDLAEGANVTMLLIDRVPQHTPDSLFAKASPGDVLFVVAETNTAYLYRPAEDAIVASGSGEVKK